MVSRPSDLESSSKVWPADNATAPDKAAAANIMLKRHPYAAVATSGYLRVYQMFCVPQMGGRAWVNTSTTKPGTLMFIMMVEDHHQNGNRSDPTQDAANSMVKDTVYAAAVTNDFLSNRD